MRTLDLVAALEDPDAEERAFAAFRLGGRNEPDAIAGLSRALSDADPEVRAVTAQSLALLGHVESLPVIIDLVRQDPGTSRSPLIWAAASLADNASTAIRESVREALTELSARASDEVRDQLAILFTDRGRRRDNARGR